MRTFRLLSIPVTVLLAGSTALPASAAPTEEGPLALEVQSLDGSGNNLAHPTWGKAGLPYSRVAPARYADGRSAPVTGPNSRFISNRAINDVNQNVFSERGNTQWVWTWGQFLDHTFGLRLGGAGNDPQGETANIPFNRNDPLETFTNDLGVIGFSRSVPAPGTGVTNPREQVNSLPSYIDGFAIYGPNDQRLEWLRDGPVDGNMANNQATLMLSGGYLPDRTARGNPSTAPVMDVDGRLRGAPNTAVVSGDVRANENIALTATHTLFAREHNRIVSQLPNTLTDEQKFQIARRVVIAEQQYVTYNEWLPTVGVRLPAYTGYKAGVNATLSNEFATVGYRMHSMIHGEFEIETDRDRYTDSRLDAFRQQGIKVEVSQDGEEVELAVPLNVAFFNPALLKDIGIGPLLKAIGGDEPQYKNDALIDNQLRSVLFQIPKPGQTGCIEPVDPACFRGVVDLGAIDIERGRDHGMPSYNQLRQAYGLPAKTSFAAIVGSQGESFPADPELTPGNEINDPDSLDFTELFDRNGAPIALDSEVASAQAVNAKRRTGLAARLRAVYGSVDRVDAFMGMIAEPRVGGSELGELQQAIWAKQFQALRDGDRFFYGNDPGLAAIRTAYGIDFRHSLSEIIAANTDIPADELSATVFTIPDEPLEPSRILGVGAGRCLDVPNSSTANGVQVQIFDCNQTQAQQWSQFADGTIRNPLANKCLDVANRQTTPGTRVQMWTCTGGANQKFTFNANGTIVGVQSGLCLDVTGVATNNGAKIQVWNCHGGSNQKWIR